VLPLSVTQQFVLAGLPVKPIPVTGGVVLAMAITPDGKRIAPI
jgi:hypothetical protein